MGRYHSEIKRALNLISKLKSIIEELPMVRECETFLRTQEEDRVIYSNQLYSRLVYIRNELKIVMFNIGIVAKLIDEILNKINQIINDFYMYSIKLSKLTKFYEEYILNLSPSVCRKIDESFFAYNSDYEQNALEVVKECVTINDIIHFFHAYIVNNEKIYQNIPAVYGDESKENSVYLKGTVTDVSLALYKEYRENKMPMQYPVEILHAGNNILILAGTTKTIISLVIDLTLPNVNIDFKIIGDINDEQIEILKNTLYKNGAQNLSIKQLENGISGLIICDIKDLVNIISSHDGLINFVSDNDKKLKKKKGGV